MERHLPILKSLCEDVGPGKDPFCACDVRISDLSVHFSVEEYDRLSKLRMLTTRSNGFTVAKEPHSGDINSQIRN